MKSIYKMLIEENANYDIVKVKSEWYIRDVDNGNLCGSGFVTKKAATEFMDNLKASM